MVTATDIRSANAAVFDGAIPALGDIGYSKDDKTLRVGDGVTPGGIKFPSGAGGGGGGALPFLTLEQFGGKADSTGTGGTDNLPALAAALATARFAPEFANYAQSPTIVCGTGRYYFSDTINLKTIVHILGQGIAQDNFNGGTYFDFPEDKTGIDIHRSNTGTSNGTNNGAADGTVIRGIKLKSAGGTLATAHGLRMRARATVAIVTEGFPGDGMHIRASAGAGTDLEGNANGWFIEDYLTRDCKGHGLYVNQNDANAGVAVRVEIRSSGLCGLWDHATLGNTYLSIRVDDWDTRKVGGCTFNGRHYLFVGSADGATDDTSTGNAPAPGGNAYWYEVEAGAAGGFYPAYDPAKAYRRAMPISCTGLSNRSYFGGALYTEGGLSDGAKSRCTVENGQADWTTGTASTGTQLGYGITSRAGFSANYKLPISDANASANSREFVASLGADRVNGVVLSSRRGADNDGNTPLNYFRYRGGDVVGEYGTDSGFPIFWRITLPNTTLTYGRDVKQPWVFSAHQLALVDTTDSGNNRIVAMGIAAPTSGNHARGEIVFNANASAGGVMGWQCVASGTPGTWKSMGTTAA